jgi:signal transduction histidine kinase
MTDTATRAGAAFGSPSVRELRDFERLLADLSARFVNLPAAEVDDAITDALRRIVEMLGVDRTALIQYAPDGETVLTHTWIAPEFDIRLPVPRSIGARYPWVIRRARAGLPVVISRLDELPPEAATDRATLESVGLRSHLTMPFVVAGRVEGAIGIGSLRRERAWPDELVERIGVLATILGNALAHKRAQEALDAAVGFERTVSDILAGLLTAARSEQDRVIMTGLRDMARVFGAERATLWQRVGDKSEFRKTHRWLAESVPTPPDSMGAVAIPWISARLVGGEVVRFARHADLPPEAVDDLPVLQALGIRAGVAVPLAVSGGVVGALSFGSSQQDREWPDALVQRVKLLGEVFASVLARREAERREELAKAEAAHAARVATVGTFAASLVHELTQPVAAIMSNAEAAVRLLGQRQPDLAELRGALADIIADDRRAGDLIQELRRFLRRGEVTKGELALTEVLDEALRVVGGEALGRGVALNVELPEDLPLVTGDRVQLQQVLLNLLLNAFDAVAAREPGARRVAVHAGPCACGVSVEVRDSGTGMDGATLARIFEPFFTTKSRGLGLGLSISRSIVEAHGGTLSVRSAPGAGTTFRVELPANAPGALHAQGAA